MTDSAQRFGSEYSWAAPTGGTPSAPPIPPPASVGAAHGPASYAAPQGQGSTAAWLSPRSTKHRLRGVAVAAMVAAVVVVGLLLAGMLKSGSDVTTIHAPASAAT